MYYKDRQETTGQEVHKGVVVSVLVGINRDRVKQSRCNNGIMDVEGKSRLTPTKRDKQGEKRTQEERSRENKSVERGVKKLTAGTARQDCAKNNRSRSMPR
jgi:uncharacterized membrane-anchored protein